MVRPIGKLCHCRSDVAPGGQEYTASGRDPEISQDLRCAEDGIAGRCENDSGYLASATVRCVQRYDVRMMPTCQANDGVVQKTPFRMAIT